ncbi:TetR/AcrR family transcriptional regulator (plasmid) [Caballeronia sp. NK8]|uniref:TetR/AcrR family transcriptional regulator n=1 Tax=Caballeronia sp. NK8 TaxID=140098 RepID=UPI001BB50C4C|nr:TetR/AcrR family transcriptional regulator [Caballeronia sp. NK8]BCQ28143.1 TetR/AcrR family transcriptional regulator [Caballeronia sp. NK8]
MDEALDGFVRVFREKGYHATSVEALSAETGLTAGSLYKAFSDKREIFVAALDHYIARRSTGLQAALTRQTSARDKIRALLDFYAAVSHGQEGQRGCLVVGSAVSLATFDDEIAERVHGSIRRLESLLRTLLKQGQADGTVSGALSVGGTARCLLCFLQGLRVVGKLGSGRAGMLSAVEEAMRLLD